MSSEQPPVEGEGSAPKGAQFSLDPEKVNPDSQPRQDGAEYLEEKGGVMSPEGLLERFREISENTDPVHAILVTEVQEVKALAERLNITVAIALPILIISAGCLALIMLDVNKVVKS